VATENECGTPSCLVDRLEQTVRQQHEDQKKFITELLHMGIQDLKEKISDLRKIVKDNGDELFGRMRQTENRVTAIETKIGNEDLDSRVDKAVEKNPDIQWLSGLRKLHYAVVSAVIIAAILSTTAALFVLFDSHDITRKDVIKEIQKSQGLQ